MLSRSPSSTLRTTLNSTWTRTAARTSRRVAPRARSEALLAPAPAGRAASTLASLPAKSRISTVFGALILLGVASTAYGVYEFYGMFTMWPREVRADLRAGIKAKNQGDLGMSERFLRRALETAQTLPLERFGADPYLKLSGIAIALAGVLEEFAKPQGAYEVYAASLAQLRAPSVAKSLSGQERLRAVALAYKLGEMAETYSQPPAEEERWLVFAVEELLRVLRDEHAKAQVHAEPSATDHDTQVALAELELPLWVEKTDVVAPLQALGAFYNRVGRQEYAVPLYLSALSVLMPANSKHTTPENRCRGADLMNSLADSLLIGAPTPERRQQAEAWVKKALAVIEATKASAKDKPEAVEHCELVLAAALFNHGSMREMAGDLDSAKNLYTESRKQSFVLKQRDGILQADTALRRLDRLRRVNEADSSINK